MVEPNDAKPSTPTPSASQAARQEREAKALRDNLRRRKDQARAIAERRPPYPEPE